RAGKIRRTAASRRSLSQIRPAQIGAIQICVIKLRSIKLGPAQIDMLQAGIAQHRPGQIQRRLPSRKLRSWLEVHEYRAREVCVFPKCWWYGPYGNRGV